MLHRRQASIAALLLATSLAAAPAVATDPYGMPVPEGQGLSCLWGGALGSVAVFCYSDVLTGAVMGVTNPLLLVPLVATGFLGGCSVGTNAAPSPVWLHRHT